ncbi:MAG TPA: hypothetical protein PKZ76_02135 [Xanthomonadaceae bacterium]|nr:hypothetical protein [Xanthomonadaceae bacterium]
MKFASVIPLFLFAMAGNAGAQSSQPPAADTFEREALVSLKRSFEDGRGIVVLVGGQRISGVVKAIGPDVVVLANREHSRILVRRERIDAVEGE